MGYVATGMSNVFSYLPASCLIALAGGDWHANCSFSIFPKKWAEKRYFLMFNERE